MRALILAAGLGTRLAPLSSLCPKPAMPIRGLPVIASLLAWLAREGVDEVMINLHHLPDLMRQAVDSHCPTGLRVHYSHEVELLGTGGAIRRVADFLRASDPSVVLAGDMLLDLDLRAALRRHRERGDRYTLLSLADDPREPEFGSLGLSDDGGLVRIGERFDLGGETATGLFVGVRIVSAAALGDWPEPEAFEDLFDWLAPMLRAGAGGIRVERLAADDCAWQPIGTPAEYLNANFAPPPVRGAKRTQHAAAAPMDDLVIGAGAEVPADTALHRVVVWPGERVPAGLSASNGVFADGRFNTTLTGKGTGSVPERS